MPMRKKADVVIIGGGIVGTAVARELARFKLDITLVEQHPDLSMGTTKANSAILHAGFDAAVGTLKAKLNVRGNELYRAWQEELGLDIKLIGSLVVATDEEGLLVLEQLHERGRQNGVPGLVLLSREAVLEREPHLTPATLGALFAPTGGIMDPFGVTLAFAENAVRNGVEVLTECKVEQVEVSDDEVVGVHTSQGFIEARYIINAAGVHADDISRSANDHSFAIHPRKGEYMLLDKSVGNFVRSVIFPTPSKVSKGIVIAPTVHHNTFVGPNALAIDDKEDLSTTAEGLAAIVAGAKSLVPGVPLNAAITQFAGLRAVADGDDFVIRPATGVRGLIHAAGIQSPGLTAAPAIAEMVVDILRSEGLSLHAKIDFCPENPARALFRDQEAPEKQKLIAENPLYGRVICRCEMVTEGDILDAIHRPCGARTLDGVKRRTRAGMGRCQGGFCGPRVTSILSRELKIPIPAVRKDTAGSFLFFDKIRGTHEVKDHE